MGYEEALKIWAAKKFEVEVTDFKLVELCCQTPNSCPTCGPEVEIELWATFVNGKGRSITWPAYDLGDLIAEILECGR